MNDMTTHRPGDNNPDPARPWTDEDLERFTDGAMDEQETDALRAALLADPEIRAGLARLQRTDALAAAMFDGLMKGDTDATARAMDQIGHNAIRRAAHRALALAASLALLLTGAFIIGRLSASTPASSPSTPPIAHAPTPTPPDITPEVSPAPAPEQRTASSVRTVLEIRYSAREPAPVDTAQIESSTLATDITDPETSDKPAPASGPSRERQILALGRAIRSAEIARATLDAMPGEEQLQACRIWARDPSLRPVAFERLARLQDDPAYAAECARIANAMSEDKHLLAWARSHNLRTTPPTHQ
jgi:hypothetical protein